MILNENEDEFLRSLDLENALPSTSQAQIEANRYRRELYLRLKSQQQTSTDTVENINLSTQIMNNRIMDKEYRFSVRSLLNG